MKEKRKREGMLACICWMLVAVLSLPPQEARAAGSFSMNYRKNQYEKQILDFTDGDSYRYLVLRNNFSYMKFVEEFRNNALDRYLVSMTDHLIETGTGPSVEEYLHTLSNIITIYDLEESPEIKEQMQMDDLKSALDYEMDIMDMCVKYASVVSNTTLSENQLASNVTTVIDGLGTAAEGIDNVIESLINLKVVLQNYEKYDTFLELIEDNSDGDLKTASSTLRNSMQNALLIKLEAYGKVNADNLGSFSEFFFNDIFFDAAKGAEIYKSDEMFRFWIDSGEDSVKFLSTLKDSWELGLDIGKLIGNVTVGGENLIRRVHEMEAIYDISIILQTEIIGRQAGVPQHYYQHADFDTSEFVDLLDYLICCRQRGEYCLYSTVAEDAGLLSWFGQLISDDTDIWYKKQMDILNNMRKALPVMPELSFAESGDDLPDDILETYEGLIRQNVDENGQVVFGCYDIDSDDVMEMIIAKQYPEFNIYDYIDGEPVLIGQCDYAYFSAVPGGKFITNGNEDIIQVYSLNDGGMKLLFECTYVADATEDPDAYNDWVAITEWLDNNESEAIPVELYESEDEAVNALQGFLYEGEGQINAPKAAKIVSSAKSMPYVGNTEYDVNIYFKNNSYVAADTVNVKGVLSAVKKDFDMDGKKEIFAVTYEPSAIAGDERNGFWFYMLERSDGKWNIAAATEVYALDWEGNYCDLSFMGTGSPDEFRSSIFLRKYNGKYQFFIESYENGVFATGVGWRLLGYCYNGGSFSPIPATGNLFFLGSDFEYYWNGEDPNLAGNYHALGFTADGFSFRRLTVEQNPETYEIVSLEQNHNDSYGAMNNWLLNDNQEPLNTTWCRIGDVSSLIPKGDLPESTTVMPSEYLLPHSDTELLSEEDIKGFSVEDIQRAVNEIYARHGKVFTLPENDEYFRSKSWYVPDGEITDEQISEDFNDCERENVDFLAGFLPTDNS